MKRILTTLLLLLLLSIGLLGALLFTKQGNETLKPILQEIAQEQLQIPLQIETLSLHPLQLTLTTPDGSRIDLNGSLDPLKRTFDLRYNAAIKELATFEPLLKTKLRGPLNTQGRAKGSLHHFIVAGHGDLAQSTTHYRLDIANLQPANLIAKVQKARIEKLLFMVYQPPMLQGPLDLEANLTNLDPQNLKGTLDATIRQASFDSALFAKEFGIDLPRTTLSSRSHLKLQGPSIQIDSKTKSNLLNLALSGSIQPQKLATNLNYDLHIARLELLKPLTKTDLQGPLHTKGTIRGDRERMVVQGTSDLANSKTSYRLLLTQLRPATLKASIAHAELSRLLFMLHQPRYAKGKLYASIKLDDLDPKRLTGHITAKLKEGRTKPEVLAKELGIKGAAITFQATNEIHLHHGKGKSDLTLTSSIANLEAKESTIDLATGAIKAPYILTIPDLDKLYFLTNRHLKGSITLTGHLEKDRDLRLKAHSQTLGGKLDLTLLNDDLQAKLRQIHFTALTDMLLYPRVFSSTLDADLNYNIATQKGRLQAQAFKGRILPNKLSFLLQQMANFDITREIYEKTTLTSTIDQQRIRSDLDMTSRLTHISSKGALLDLAANRVEARLRIDIQGRPLYVKITGHLPDPKITLDARALLRERAKKEIKKRLEKRLKEQLPEAAKGILDLF
ncbi:MAG: hypothetical protein C6I00_00410 [Nitratiruptor sp.]|nr:hypothetical protein [Nitratiruptor sp.]NPA84304.1 hypothetical protein [Campylobacterota bacterium]